MSTTEPAAKKSRYLLTDWNPNDESTWDSKLAWRTLWITTYSLIPGLLRVVPAQRHRAEADASRLRSE